MISQHVLMFCGPCDVSWNWLHRDWTDTSSTFWIYNYSSYLLGNFHIVTFNFRRMCILTNVLFIRVSGFTQYGTIYWYSPISSVEFPRLGTWGSEQVNQLSYFWPFVMIKRLKLSKHCLKITKQRKGTGIDFKYLLSTRSLIRHLKILQ